MRAMNLLVAPETWPFGVALAVMVGVAIVEGAGLLFASSPSTWLENVMPELHVDADGPLAWLHLGRVPVLVLLVLFLAGFALAGYVVQGVAHGLGGALLPSWLAAIPAALAGLSTVSGIGALVARIIPSDETTAVSEQTLIGRPAVVIAGTARAGLAAQAKVRDAHGHVHYVMVEPDLQGQTFAEGAAIVLVGKTGSRFRCIANPHPQLP